MNKKTKGIGIISGTKVIVGDPNTKSFLQQKCFGEKAGKRHDLSLIEAIFLVETENIEVSDGEKKLKFEDLLKIGSKVEENFYIKYIVYKDLRERGLLVRTGLKFGTDFRVYERGETISKGHSRYLVHVIPEEYTCSFPELARGVRLAKGVHKDIIFAIVDEESDVTYYMVDRVRL